MAAMEEELQPVGVAAHAAVHASDDVDNDLIQSLPPMDRGIDAWKFLLGSFAIEAILWGFAANFGVFQDYYSQQPEFEGNDKIAVIGTVATSVYFLGAPIASQLVKRFQRWQRHLVVFGCALCVLSLVVASFCASVSGLIATQGFMYGFGFLILYFPVLRMLDEWFAKRRGLAYAVLSAGGGISGICLPFILEWLLSAYGYRTTLRIVAVSQFILIGPVLPLLKGRLPPSNNTSMRKSDVKFLAKPLFYCFAISNLCQGLGYYIPSLYLPSFASAIGSSGTIGASVLALNNIATVGGQLCFGHLVDRGTDVLILVSITTIVSSIASFTLWGFSTSLGPLMVFAIIYGWFAGAFAVFWPKFGSLLSDDPQAVYSLMAFGKGIGNILIGPISAGLLTRPISSGYGMGRYQSLVVFLGVSMFCSSLAILGWPLRTRLRIN
ncbi:major facilitator superfamily domain-containing protein [Xylariales sp. PMI_506]|nr:major facilitator superfamily domain-containing protein [Xylariales sp. PMI_506]